MNKLESTVIDQYKRVTAAGVNGAATLREAQDEIMAAATPERFEEIVVRTSVDFRVTLQNGPGHTSRLARAGLIVPEQGYVGGIINAGPPIVYAYSARVSEAAASKPDPIQEAMGDAFYPAMALAKAVRAAAYEGRGGSERRLTIAEYLAAHGLSLGSNVTLLDDFVGATGFMPGDNLSAELAQHEAIAEHLVSEPIEAFRGSGLCDQIAVDSIAQTHPVAFAASVLRASGSLN
jgi:hypothetical protein